MKIIHKKEETRTLHTWKKIVVLAFIDPFDPLPIQQYSHEINITWAPLRGGVVALRFCDPSTLALGKQKLKVRARNQRQFPSLKSLATDPKGVVTWAFHANWLQSNLKIWEDPLLHSHQNERLMLTCQYFSKVLELGKSKGNLIKLTDLMKKC